MLHQKGGNLLILSIFPGIDLLGRAFEEEGFCVVRGPDPLWGGDIKAFHPPSGAFAGVIGGPPCQLFSIIRYINPHCGEKTGNLIPEFERVVAEVQPAWWLMENVRGAPVPKAEDYYVQSFLLNNRDVGGIQHRIRRFSFGSRSGVKIYPEVVVLVASLWQRSVLGNQRTVPFKLGKNGVPKSISVVSGHGPFKNQRRDLGSKTLTVAEMCELQGLPPEFCDEMPFTMEGKRKVIGNGVSLLMGKAIARAIKKATEIEGEK